MAVVIALAVVCSGGGDDDVSVSMYHTSGHPQGLYTYII